jgi:flavodoxin
MEIANIIEEDVVFVAQSIGKELTSDEIELILKIYPDAQIDDPTSTWDLVIENIIYSITSKK